MSPRLVERLLPLEARGGDRSSSAPGWRAWCSARPTSWGPATPSCRPCSRPGGGRGRAARRRLAIACSRSRSRTRPRACWPRSSARRGPSRPCSTSWARRPFPIRGLLERLARVAGALGRPRPCGCARSRSRRRTGAPAPAATRGCCPTSSTACSATRCPIPRRSRPCSAGGSCPSTRPCAAAVARGVRLPGFLRRQAPLEADVAVVGSGLPALAAALELGPPRRERRRSRRRSRRGAAPRPRPGPAAAPAARTREVARAIGRSEARLVWAAGCENHLRLRALVEEARRDCGYAPRGSFLLARDRAEAALLAESEDLLRDDGFPGEFLDHYMLETRFDLIGLPGRLLGRRGRGDRRPHACSARSARGRAPPASCSSPGRSAGSWPTRPARGSRWRRAPCGPGRSCSRRTGRVDGLVPELAAPPATRRRRPACALRSWRGPSCPRRPGPPTAASPGRRRGGSLLLAGIGAAEARRRRGPRGLRQPDPRRHGRGPALGRAGRGVRGRPADRGPAARPAPRRGLRLRGAVARPRLRRGPLDGRRRPLRLGSDPRSPARHARRACGASV